MQAWPDSEIFKDLNLEKTAMSIDASPGSIYRSILATILILIPLTGAYAAGRHSGDYGNKPGHATNVGKAGKASEAARVIGITMTDNSFAPERIIVAKGETIRFVVTNNGEFLHEFNVGTAAMHAQHQQEMAVMFRLGILEADKDRHDRMNVAAGRMMTHDDPNSLMLEPGETGEIIWKFGSEPKLEFACNLPGHYQSGMVGKFSIR